ncbi:hypothetical protein F5883DRAFT_529257 [Diaporthe sp. PMI_573]|nr:hypothetical protein F5883DRAFT_529257 [Diaporthaceae sp. PMI_573]
MTTTATATATATATVAPSEMAALLNAAAEIAKANAGGGALDTGSKWAAIVCAVGVLAGRLFPGWPRPGWLGRLLARQQQHQQQPPPPPGAAEAAAAAVAAPPPAPAAGRLGPWVRAGARWVGAAAAWLAEQ